MDRNPSESAGISAGSRRSKYQRARLIRAAVCFLALAGTPLFFDQTGGANEAARQGWWWAANPGQGAPAPPGPPDVPADGLYVEGGPNGPVASAAVLFQLQDGETPQQLTLHLVPAAQAVQSQVPPAPASVPAPAGLSPLFS